jgi:hypothetical protein
LQHDCHADEQLDATMKSRGSGIPVLMPSFAMMLAQHRRRRGQDSRSPGRARINRNTIARGRPGVFGQTCGDCRLRFFCRRATGAASARPSLRPHFQEGGIFETKLGCSAPRERRRMHDWGRRMMVMPSRPHRALRRTRDAYYRRSIDDDAFNSKPSRAGAMSRRSSRWCPGALS